MKNQKSHLMPEHRVGCLKLLAENLHCLMVVFQVVAGNLYQNKIFMYNIQIALTNNIKYQ